MTGLCGPGFDVTDFFGTLTSPAALEQDLTYREEKIPEIITERLDAIDKVLFGQPFDDFEADRRLDDTAILWICASSFRTKNGPLTEWRLLNTASN